jgi:hypothetical protein
MQDGHPQEHEASIDLYKYIMTGRHMTNTIGALLTMNVLRLRIVTDHHLPTFVTS